MQIKTTRRFHSIPIRLAKIRKLDNAKQRSKECKSTGIPLHCWWKYRPMPFSGETVLHYPHTLNVHTSWPRRSVPRLYNWNQFFSPKSQRDVRVTCSLCKWQLLEQCSCWQSRIYTMAWTWSSIAGKVTPKVEDIHYVVSRSIRCDRYLYTCQRKEIIKHSSLWKSQK